MFALLFLTHLLRWGEALVPAVLVALVAYVVLARRVARAVQAISTEASAFVAQPPPRFDRAVAHLQRGYPMGRWQFGVRHQLDAQVGMLWFLKGDMGRALPPLKRSMLLAPWQAAAMLGVIYFRRKDYAQVRQAFAVVVRKGRKQPLALCLWAYLLVQMGHGDEAMAVLAAGSAKLGDLRLREAHLALQNGKKLKMRAFGDAWYQFQLERPPAQAAPAMMGGRGMRRAMQRGRR